MIRKLAIALSLLGVCFTGLVHALGLGEVTVKSALNQPLNAEIELVNTAGLAVNEILPGLATREEFQKANVDRVYFLSDLRFEVTTNSQGKARIILTSKKPVREPFLNFIVELIWPSGRLLREYALLIDPPLFSDQPKTNVNTPRVSSQQSGDVLSVPASPAASSRSILAPADRIESGSYGPTDANDTLWDIAIKARPNRSVSPQQVMLAIQDLNPNAFINNNINKLKAGQVLRLPTEDQIKERSQHQAIQLVIAQNEANAGKRSPSVAQGSKSTSSTTPSRPSRQQVSGDELKLVVSNEGDSNSSNSANSGESNQSGAGANNKLAVTLEKLDKASIENKELNGRVSDLEEQLSTLQRLLTLKNDQLASIQSQMRANELQKLQSSSDPSNSDSLDNNDPLASDTTPLDSMANTQESDTTIESTVDDASISNNESLTADQSSETKQEALAEEKDAVMPSGSDEKASDVVASSPKNISNEPSPKPSTETSSQNLIQTIIANPLYLTIALISVLLLVFVLWLVSRHNAKREEEFQSQNGLMTNDDVFDDNNTSDLNAFDSNDETEELGFDSDSLEDSHDELTESGSEFAEELDEESQDVLAEAEAYISYGRLDQAVQILEKAISQDPVRTDYRLKLLAVYKDLGDRQAFDRQFSELEAIQDSAALAEAENIRSELIEEESLAFDANDTLQSSQDIKAAEEAESVETSEELDPALEEESKSFDFDSVSLEEPEEELDLSSELDLDSLNADSQSELDEVSLAEEADDVVEMEDVLSLDESTVESDPLLETVTEDDFDDSILDVDLDDLDLNAELDQESEIDLDSANDLKDAIQSTGADEDLVVSDDVLEEAAQAFEEDSDSAELDSDLTETDEFDFLNGTDEASTKLDLARAYIDMGDTEGAKDILLEVTKEGSEAQQAEAQELIDSID